MKECSIIILIIKHFKYKLSFALLLLQGFYLSLGAQTDSLYYSIDSTTFFSVRNESMIDGTLSGKLKIDMEKMQKLPKILGNTDPVSFIRLLPEVQTNSDNDSGIHIQGCDNSHNEITLGGVPVYGVNHLMGLFSIFNPSHYQSMNYLGNSYANRLGGMLDMSLPEANAKVLSGDLSVGMISSQGSLALSLGKYSSMRLSARKSYLNFLFKSFMKINESPFNYGFGDYNATYMYEKGKNKVWIDLYTGNDGVTLDEHAYGVKLSSNWGNGLGAVHWNRTSVNLKQKHTLYFSGFLSSVAVSQEMAHLALDSRIFSYGYKSNISWKDWSGDVDVNYYDVIPQNIELTGFLNEVNEKERHRALELSLRSSYSKTLFDRLEIDTSLRGSFYISDSKYRYWRISPATSITYNLYHKGKIRVNYGWKHQFLFQTGITNIGFPIEFWLLSGNYSKPQYCQYLEFGYQTNLFNDTYNFSIDCYGKELYNQMEYKGDLFDLFLSEYDIGNNLLKGKGWNYGLNLKLHKRSGNMTGWISYSFGRSLRQFDNPDYTDIYPADHERLHEFNAVCSYTWKKWDFSGVFIYAGGVPFTAPEYFYISSGAIMTKYGKHNGERMKPYIRLDLSANYCFFNKNGTESGINISIHNVLARKNYVMYKLYLYDDGFIYDGMCFPLRFLPSVSYYYKF